MSENNTELSRAKIGSAVGLVGIICNTLLCVGKFIAGIISGSVSITADAANNLSDASSSIVSLLGFKLSEKDPDKEHPYGHARYEYISGFVVSLLVILIGIELLKSGIERIITPEPVEFTALSAVILTVSIAVKLGMMLLNRAFGKKIGSQTLLAAAADSRNDVFTTAAVLGGAALSHYSDLELDGIMAVFVAVFILYSGIGLVREAMNPLLGNAPSPEMVEQFRRKILSYPGVLGTHDLIVHDYGHGRKFATVHVEMAAEADVISSHSIIDEIERDFLKEDGINLLVHFDPVITDRSALSDTRRELDRIVNLIDSRLTTHDLRIVHCADCTKAFFDVVIPPNFSMTNSELEEEITRFARRYQPDIKCIITFDSSFAAIPPQNSQE